MDPIPGPIIAMVAPRTASMMAISEIPDHASDIQASTVAIVIPATGVQRLRRRNVPTDSRNQKREAGRRCSVFTEMRGPAIEQNRACQHALK
jgi:hypothetical protein